MVFVFYTTAGFQLRNQLLFQLGGTRYNLPISLIKAPSAVQRHFGVFSFGFPFVVTEMCLGEASMCDPV